VIAFQRFLVAAVVTPWYHASWVKYTGNGWKELEFILFPETAFVYQDSWLCGVLTVANVKYARRYVEGKVWSVKEESIIVWFYTRYSSVYTLFLLLACSLLFFDRWARPSFQSRIEDWRNAFLTLMLLVDVEDRLRLGARWEFKVLFR